MFETILGIDPGLHFTGFCLLGDNNRLVEYGEINTKKKSKLKHIYLELEAIIKKYKPDLISIEKPFVNINFNTSLILGRAQGIPILLAELYDIPYIEATPSEIRKQILGKGNSQKEDTEMFINKLFNVSNLSNNVSDAILIAMYGFQFNFQSPS